MKTPAIAVQPHRAHRGAALLGELGGDGGGLAEVAAHPAEDEDGVGDEEEREDRGEDAHRLLHAAQVEDHEQHDGRPLGGDLPGRERGRQEAPDGLASRGDRHRDGEDVVDEQRGAGDEAGSRAQEPRRHHVPAAAEGEVLDDPGVGERDEQHRPGRRERQRRGEEVQVADGPVELVGAVGRGGEAVGAQPHPGEQRDERDVVVGPRVVDVPGRAEEDAAQACVENGSSMLASSAAERAVREAEDRRRA